MVWLFREWTKNATSSRSRRWHWSLIEGVQPDTSMFRRELQSLTSDDSTIDEASASSGDPTIRSRAKTSNRLGQGFLSLIEYKEQKGMDNLVVRPGRLRTIMVLRCQLRTSWSQRKR